MLWFSGPTGGFSLGSGGSYTTPVISSTTTYYVTTTASGCTTPSRVAVVASVLSAGECSRGSNQGGGVNGEPGSVQVFPNPNDGAFSVVIPADQKDAMISVLDIAGREVATQAVSDNDGSPVMVKLNQVAPGMYFVRVTAGAYSTIVRLVIR